MCNRPIRTCLISSTDSLVGRELSQSEFTRETFTAKTRSRSETFCIS